MMNVAKRVHCEQLAPFVKGLLKVLQEHGCGGAELKNFLHASVSAACVQCAIKLSGEDLLGLGTSGGGKSGKNARLEAGFCARKGCDSYYYDFEFQQSGAFNWQEILLETERAMEAIKQEASENAPSNRGDRFEEWRETILKRVLQFAAILLLFGTLWGARYWRDGGAIPIIRPLNEFQNTSNSLPPGETCPSCGRIH
jgi:hypothetical protein